MAEQFNGSDHRDFQSFPPSQGIITGSLREGWEAIKRDPILLIGLSLLLSTFVIIFTGFLPNLLHSRIDLFEIGDRVVQGESGFGPLKIVGWLLFHLLKVGMLYTCLRVVRRESVPFSSIFSGFPRFIHILIADILVGIAIFWGVILLIIPAIFIGIVFSMRGLLILEMDLDCIRALRGSWMMMKGYRTDFLLLWLLLIAINIAGMIPLGIGLIITIPLSYATIAAFFNFVYKENPPTFP